MLTSCELKMMVKKELFPRRCCRGGFNPRESSCLARHGPGAVMGLQGRARG